VLICLAKFLVDADMGLPVNSAPWQRPHLAATAFFPAGTRFTASQAGHTRWNASVLMMTRTVEGGLQIPSS
jgi:hypothetical protein